ncbi:Uncharacterised protein [Mycobacteroides abscessus subsp. abscessus]|nr:Uncharacterised protein [Mycobacteroides abscessus subsp. abscessus]
MTIAGFEKSLPAASGSALAITGTHSATTALTTAAVAHRVINAPSKTSVTSETNEVHGARVTPVKSTRR